jgi:hypothetical protein
VTHIHVAAAGYGAAVSVDPDRGAQPGESPKERHDRELIELLNELRVTLPGVQVLFAFLFAVPFAKGWSKVTHFQRDVFVVAFLAAAVSSVLLIAPSSYHRLRWRAEDKGHIVRVGNAFTIGGMAFLAVALIAAVLLVMDVVLSLEAAIVASTAVGVVVVGLWYGLPLYSHLDDRRDR